MTTKKTLFLLLLLPTLSFSQQKIIKIWNDKVLKADFTMEYTSEKRWYSFIAEKFQRESEYGILVKGSAERIREVVSQMQNAFQSKDPNKTLSLGRYKYSYTTVPAKEFIVVELLKIEDLIKDENGERPVYMLSAEMLSSVAAFAEGLN